MKEEADSAEHGILITKIIIMRYHNRSKSALDSKIEHLVNIKIMTEAAGSDNTARRFLIHSPRKEYIRPASMKKCRKEIRETFEKVYTIFRSIIQVINRSFVTNRPEFIFFTKRFSLCCVDKGTP